MDSLRRHRTPRWLNARLRLSLLTIPQWIALIATAIVDVGLYLWLAGLPLPRFWATAGFTCAWPSSSRSAVCSACCSMPWPTIGANRSSARPSSICYVRISMTKEQSVPASNAPGVGDVMHRADPTTESSHRIIPFPRRRSPNPRPRRHNGILPLPPGATSLCVTADGVLVYDDGRARGVLRISPINLNSLGDQEQKADPSCVVLPRYWVPREEVESRLADRWGRGWLLGWRDITNATNERTVIASAFPRVGSGDTFLLAFPSTAEPGHMAALLGNWNSIVLDYAARQKVGGTHLKYHLFKQLPILAPQAYTPTDLNYILPRVLELVYTAWDMQPFAQDLGYNGPPFAWDEKRRAVLRAELDAYYARLYGLTRKQLRYILDPHDLTDRELENILDPYEDPPDVPRTKDFPGETFRVLKEREMKQYGEYRTRRLVLEAWDCLARDGADLGAPASLPAQQFAARG